MLSGEGDAGERWKTTICLISKKQLCTCSRLFWYISLPLFCTTTTWYFQKRLSYTRSRRPRGGNIVRVLVHFIFSLPIVFTLHWWPLAFLIFSLPLQNCHIVLPTKKMSPLFSSLALDLCRPFSRWALLAYRLISLFLCLSLALFSKFVDMTINLSLILSKTRIEKQFPLSVFVFIRAIYTRKNKTGLTLDAS